MTPETSREDAGKPPTPWTTIDKVSREWGLYDVVSRALLGKFSPSRRQLLVGNIVMAVAKWRENFRDCGCWKTDDGYALCPWHERMLQSQVAPLRAALADEADRGTPVLHSDPVLHAAGKERRSSEESLGEWLNRQTIAAWIASPDTVDMVARAVHAEDESIESDPLDYDECPDRADHRDYAAALIEVMRQEMER